MPLVFAMKCCTKMPCPLPHNHCCCLILSPYLMLASPAHLYMPHLLTHCLPTIICVMLMSIVFFYFCYMLHFFVTPFGLFVYIFSSSFLFLCHSMWLLQFCIVTFPMVFHAIHVSDLIPIPQISDGVGMMKHVCVFVEKFAPNNSCHSTSSFLLPPNWTAEEWLSTLNETCKNE